MLQYSFLLTSVPAIHIDLCASFPEGQSKQLYHLILWALRNWGYFLSILIFSCSYESYIFREAFLHNGLRTLS